MLTPASFANPSSPFALAQITAKSGSGPTAEYSFVEVWLLDGASGDGAVEKVAARYGSAAAGNVGYCVNGGELEVDDYCLFRSADGTGGLFWELLSISSGGTLEGPDDPEENAVPTFNPGGDLQNTPLYVVPDTSPNSTTVYLY